MLGEDQFLLNTPVYRVKLHVQRAQAPRDATEAAARRSLALTLRVGVEHREPEIARLVLRLHRALFVAGGLAVDPLIDPRPVSARLLADRLRLVIDEIERGRVRVERERLRSLTDARAGELPELPPLPPPRAEPETTFFEVRLVDEVGQAVTGVEVAFEVDGDFQNLPTNAAGVALLDPAKSSTAQIRLEAVEDMSAALDARWTKRRAGAPPKEGNRTEQTFTGAPIGPLAVKAVVPNLVVLGPPLGRIFLQLFDKSGRVRLAHRSYTIEGPESLSGKTDAEGILLHERVFPGDYTLELTLEAFDAEDKQTDIVTSPLVVLAPNAPGPEIRALGAVPLCVLARARLFFNTNKAFLLPTAFPGMRALRKLYRESEPSKLLVVGHADTTGGAAFNDALSLERAEATIAFLKDDVDAWLSFYDASVEKKKRWGAPEDRMLLISAKGFREKPPGLDAVRWFQSTRELEVDGKVGPETRRQLITEYMALDGVSLKDFARVEALAHGCGENFPLDETSEQLDPAPEDQKRDPGDRRVELFFFDAEFGVVPKPPGKNSPPGSREYPEWRKRVVRTVDLEAGELDGPKLTFVELLDSLFRTDSAVVLPEGESPSASAEKHEALTSIGAFAALLRFNDERTGRKLLIAGHCDTTASVEFNQTLSEERAECALAVLTGDRASFQSLCDARHTVGDYKQILAWVARAFPDLEFACDPGRIDDVEGTGVEPVRSFQNAYNANKTALGAAADDLEPDGDVGPLTWGAFFDCYELALRRELGEDADGVAALREKLVFVDDDRKSLGFSEHFPIEELGVENFKSQANRRVEMLLFEAGEEPDLEHAQADPETSEIYLPGVFRREPIATDSAQAGAFVSQEFVVPMEVDPDRDPATETSLELVGPEAFVQRLKFGDPDVALGPGGLTLLFRFRDLPRGRFRLYTVTGAGRHCIMRGIDVRKDGVFVGGSALPVEVPPPATDREVTLEPAPDPERAVDEVFLC